MPRIMPTLAWICIFLGTTGRLRTYIKIPDEFERKQMSSPYHGLCLTWPDCCRGRSGHRGRDCVFQEVRRDPISMCHGGA